MTQGTPLTAPELAMLIDAMSRTPDPITRFIDSLSDKPLGLKSFAKETLQLRAELIEHVNALLTERDPRRAMAHADWISRHVHDVGYRWSGLVRSVEHWTRLDTGALKIRIERSP